jgi:hypothetical protein
LALHRPSMCAPADPHPLPQCFDRTADLFASDSANARRWPTMWQWTEFATGLIVLPAARSRRSRQTPWSLDEAR